MALSVIMAHRPSRPLPFQIDELKSGKAPRRRRLGPVGLSFVGLDKALHRYEAVAEQSWPKRVIRGAALREAERWMVARQEADGSWGGIQPPMVYSTIALVLQGYPLDHPVVAAALAGLERFTLDDEAGRRIEACQSPIWDTALAVIALVDAGAAPDDPAVDGGRRLAARERGDCRRRLGRAPARPRSRRLVLRVRRTSTTPISTTPRRSSWPCATRPAKPGRDAACDRALDWVVGMQSSDGGWGAFDADNNSPLPDATAFLRLRRRHRPADRRRHGPRRRDARLRSQAGPLGRRPGRRP